MLRVLPYKMTSKSAKDLTRELETRRINLYTRVYRPTEADILINWGNASEYAHSLVPRVGKIFNSPEHVAKAVNKIKFFEVCKKNKLKCPEWTTDHATAVRLARDHDIVVRSLITANSGRGITLVRQGAQEVPRGKLYTVYTPKKIEYRVHVCGGVVFDVQQKKLRRGTENPNFQIRSWDNGWIFAREGVRAPKVVTDLAIASVKALKLDFGAVDIGYNELKKQATVYEVNTAPGLEGTTLDTYTRTIKRMVESYVQAQNRERRPERPKNRKHRLVSP